jgi:hypothetical protein
VLLQAGALDRGGSTKSGAFTLGPFPGGGQFGEVRIDDVGSATVGVTLTGWSWDLRRVLEMRFDVPATPRP